MDSFPVRWQVYGSGPRLAWEWAAVVILAVVLLAVVIGGLLGLASGLEPGPWLEPAGIMLIANQSNTMENTKGSVGGVISQQAAEGRYYLRESVRDGKPSLVLVDSEAYQNTSGIKKTKTYTNEGHGIIATREVDLKIWRPTIAYIRDLFSKIERAWKRYLK